MDKKIIGGMLAIGVGGFLLGMIVTPKTPIAPVTIEKKNNNGMRVVSIREKTNPLYVINAEYPQFDTANDAFNKEIADWANGMVADFKKNAEDNWKARQATALPGEKIGQYPPQPFTCAITWEPEQINGDVISIIVRLDSFEGGAHGRQELKTFNFDVIKQKDIALADLFPGDPGYLGKVSKYAHDRLVEQLVTPGDGADIMNNMISDGTAPTAENFENFLFNDDMIDLYFPKYQVAPGAAGEQHILFPRKGI